MAEPRRRHDDGRDDRSPRAVEFLRRLAAIELEYGFALEHEDSHGAFIVRPWNNEAVDWLLDGYDGTDG